MYRVRLLLAELLVESDKEEAAAIFDSLINNVEAGHISIEGVAFLADME